jgi:hypothetical protein
MASQDQTHRERVYRPLQFQKRSQLFVGTDNEMLSLAVGVKDPNCAPVIVER